MAIESAVLLRRVARNGCLFLILGLLLGGLATAQLPQQVPVPVTVGSVVPFHHGSTGTWSQIYALKFAPNGNLIFMDSAISQIYQLAPGAATPTLVVGAAPTGGSSNCSTLEPSGSYWNAGIAIDANNTLYVTDRYGSSVHFCRVPYDAAHGTWTFSASDNWSGGPVVSANGVNTAISPQDVVIGDDGTFYVSWSNTGEIDKFKLDANGNAQQVTRVMTGMQTFVSNLAVDHAGNLFFLENVYVAPGSRVPGIREIPANTTLPLTGDSTGSLEKSLPRIDDGYDGVKGLTFDAAGNLYFTSENNSSYGGAVNGVFMIPNEGTPTNPNLVWADTIMISPIGSGFPVALDPRGYIWVPTGGGGNNWTLPGSTAPTCDTTNNTTINATCTSSSVVLWAPGSLALGASAIGTPGSPQTLIYLFSQPTTPASIALTGEGANNFSILSTNPFADTTTDPPIAPCTAGQAYPAFSASETSAATYNWCAVYLQQNATSTGLEAAEVQLLDGSNKVITGSNAYIYGVGQGSAISALSPPQVVTTASGLNKPYQVAADMAGTTYVADSGLKAVEKYPAGSNGATGSTVGTGLSSPTGAAVDGTGDLYIGDSGKVIEIPFINNALAASKQTTLLTGLGNHLNLATDGLGNVYVADADKAQVVKISNPSVGMYLQNAGLNKLSNGSTWTGPSAIATDNTGDVFVADGSNLWEISPMGGPKELTSSLAAPVTGLAVDPSGSVFVAGATGLLWIPYSSSTGGLNMNGAITVASGLGSGGTAVPFSVALDGGGNAFVTYGSGATAGLAQLGIGGAVDWGQIVPFLENDQEAELVNIGNSPLTFSDFTSDTTSGANAADYSVGTPADSPACDPLTPTEPGAACFFGIALTPSTAGASSASIAVATDAANAPMLTIALTAQAVPDNRMPTTTSVSISPSSGVIYPGTETVTVTVAANDSANGTPTGSVVVTVSGQPKQTQPLVNGVATFTYNNLLGGTYNVVADYGGDGTAGTAPYPSCSESSSCYSVSAAKSSFTINTAVPAVSVGAPVGSVKNVTVWAGNTYLSVAKANTITATVTSTVGTPTGTVSFDLPNGQPADPSQATIPLDANGNAVFSTSNLPQGTYNLTLAYSGDTNYTATKIPVAAFQVIVPSVQVSADPPSTTITAGTPDQVTLTLKPLVGFSQQVNVQCVTASLPQYSECTFDNPEIAVGRGSDPTATSTIVVTISTNVPVNGVTSSVARPVPWSLAGIFGLGLVGLIAGRKRINRYLLLVSMSILFSGAFLGLTSCTNSGYSTPLPAPKVKTPAGTYQVEVVTVDPSNGQQDSLSSPPFILTTTVQ